MVGNRLRVQDRIHSGAKGGTRTNIRKSQQNSRPYSSNKGHSYSTFLHVEEKGGDQGPKAREEKNAIKGGALTRGVQKEMINTRKDRKLSIYRKRRIKWREPKPRMSKGQES